MDKFFLWQFAKDLLMAVTFLSVFMFIWFFNRFSKMERLVAVIIFLYAGADFTASIMAAYKIHNLWFYSIVLIPQLLLVTYALTYKLADHRKRKFLFLVSILIAISHCVNIIFFQGMETLNTYTYIPGNTWISVCAFLYLKEQIEKLEINPFEHLFTWFALATMIDHVGSIPILLTLSWPVFNEITSAGLVVFNQGLYMFWYLIISFGLIWTKTSLRSRFSSR